MSPELVTEGALLWEPGQSRGWSVEEIRIDPPHAGEVLVRLAAAGLCHSDHHLDTGDIAIDWAPLLGGHEGAGTIVECGPGVTGHAPGDRVVFSYIPSCGRCRMCVEGRTNLCDVGVGVLAGTAPDGTQRIHARGQGVGAMSFLGTFSPYVVAQEASLIPVPDDVPLELAALVGCGVPTGWGSAVYAADTQVGDIVVVIGVGGVGINAVQGARAAGAAVVVVVDPQEWKWERSKVFGATHSAASVDDAVAVVERLTAGVGADRVIITVDVARSEIVQGAAALTRKGGVVVFTSVAPQHQESVGLDAFTFAMSEKVLRGCLFGSCKPRNDIPMLLRQYRAGQLKLDELITARYRLADINQGFADMAAGRNFRGIIAYD
jgi:NDMA-dependent alcohol dehydrogenase